MNELNGFTILDYNVHGFKEGSTTAICPVCSHTRKPENQKVKCMSLFWETGLGVCNHCAEKRLQLHTYEKKQTNKTYLKPTVSDSKLSISNELEKYAKDIRSISLDTLKRLKIHSSISWMPKAKKEISVIKIPYYFHGELINVKYRGANKDFMFEKGCEKIIYNIDAIIGEKECIITEGEPDTWSYDEVGLNYVCSVPNGFTLPRADGTSSINTDYLDNYYEIFETKERIYLALDNDDAGKCGEAELIRRFGAEKCWLVDFKDCKDANEYLIKYKDEALIQTIKDAKQVPLEYVETLKDFEQELDDFWLNGSPKGYTTDIRDLDAIYSTEVGQYTIVTGPPQCFTKEQKVLTDKGSKEISELKKGDLVLSYNENKKQNEYKKVVNTMVNKDTPDKILKITLKNGTVIKCTENHRFFNGTSYVKIKDLLLSFPNDKKY